jgi:hypothetical protein
MVSAMTVRAWVGVSALFRPLSAPAGLLMVLGWCTASAELYATLLEAPQRPESGALLLVAANMFIAGWLSFNLLQLAHELKQLRLPEHRQVIGAPLAFVLGLTLVGPCALVFSLHGSVRDLLVVSAGACAGIAGAIVCRYRGSARLPETSHAQTLGAAESTSRPPPPLRTLRIMLGAPCAPASWRRRFIEIAVVCAVLVSAPLLLIILNFSAGFRFHRVAFHASELVGLLAAMTLCWTYPLNRVLALLDPKRGALTELAVLPGLGNGTRQRRQLYLATLSLPTAALVGLFIVAVSVAWLQKLPSSVYWNLAMQFALFPLVTLPMLLSQLARRTGVSGMFAPNAFVSLSPAWALTSMIWTWPVDGPPLWSVYGPSIFGLLVAVVLAVPLVLVGQTIYFLHKLALRPHPFVDVSP